MKITETCTGCEICLPYCPQGAISMTEALQATIDREACVECGVCIDLDICPVSAFEEDQDDLASYKRRFGRLLSKHLDQRHAAKESPYDVKTNDATGKIPEHQVAVRLELNRPGGGLSFRDVLEVGAEMQHRGWNPDISSRSLNMEEESLTDETLNRRILTCHLEMVLDPVRLPHAVRDAVECITQRNLWVSINVAGRLETIDRTLEIVKSAEINVEPVAKVNLGLARRTQ